MEKVKIVVISEGLRRTAVDFVTAEVPLTLKINQKEPHLTLFCSPVDLKEMVLGFLYTSGLIQKSADLKKIALNRKQWKADVEIEPSLFTSRHRRLSSKSAFPGKNIIELMKKFQKSSPEFRRTGGVHSTALCNREKILCRADDIGRHNALDKIIGKALLKNLRFEDKMALITGRVSSETLSKIQFCGIPVIASISAPTDRAVKLAQKTDITLIGFVRGNRMNIYTGAERIT